MAYTLMACVSLNSPPLVARPSPSRTLVMARFTDSLITLGLMVLGFVIMVTPLALWVAWTETVLLLVLAAGATAGVLYCVLVRFEGQPHSVGSETSDPVRAEALPDRLIEELQSLHPFIHHHRPSGGARFRIVMDRLKTRVDRRPS